MYRLYAVEQDYVDLDFWKDREDINYNEVLAGIGNEYEVYEKDTETPLTYKELRALDIDLFIYTKNTASALKQELANLFDYDIKNIIVYECENN